MRKSPPERFNQGLTASDPGGPAPTGRAASDLATTLPFLSIQGVPPAHAMITCRHCRQSRPHLLEKSVGPEAEIPITIPQVGGLDLQCVYTLELDLDGVLEISNCFPNRTYPPTKTRGPSNPLAIRTFSKGGRLRSHSRSDVNLKRRDRWATPGQWTACSDSASPGDSVPSSRSRSWRYERDSKPRHDNRQASRECSFSCFLPTKPFVKLEVYRRHNFSLAR